MKTEAKITVTRPTEDALIGIDRALSFYEQELQKSPTPDTDLLSCLGFAQLWFMKIQGEIHADNVAAEREPVPTDCPKCGSPEYGEHCGGPVTMPGWYGNQRFAWGRSGGAQVVRLTGKRCSGCGHVEAIDPDFDR